MTPPDDPRVARAVDEFLAAEHRPSRDAFLAKHPEIAAELAECLDGLAFIQGAAERVHRSLDEPAVPPLPDPLGDFRIVREVGRGGMGVVYEAVQFSLGRRVALKVLPFAAALDSKQLQRFRNEALAAAYLSHPHIVPVYGVGCERGVHYYAMQFIDGQTLADVIRGLKAAEPGHPAGDTPVNVAGLSTAQSHRSAAFIRSAAELGACAAEALEHAHQMGIVHRDVKPANLMVDGRGHVWVADFGLAQVRGGPDLTRTGDAVGTLRYMAPEQAAAGHDLVDGRADVYALGVTLYELLTLRPAIDGRDRPEVNRQLLDGSPPSPRRLNPAVPVDLETALLKAITRDPGDRYATAQAFAADLRRFLDGRPVVARRPGLGRRAAGWANRHRPVIVAVAAVLVLAVVGLAVGLTYVAGERAEAARQRDRARRAVDDMYTDVAERWLGGEPGLEDVQREFLRKALAYYREFARADDREPEARAAVARAHRRVGDIQRRLEVYPDAESAYREAVLRFHALADEHPSRREFRAELADGHHALAGLLLQTKRAAEAEAAYRAAVAVREQLLDGSDPARRDLGASMSGLARALHFTNRTTEAVEAYDRAVGLLESSPGGADSEEQLGTTLAHLAELRSETGRRTQARELLERAVAHRRSALAARPRDPVCRRTLADVLVHLGAVRNRLADTAKAEEAYREALTVQDRLADDFPRTGAYRANLARTYTDLADMLLFAGRPAAETYRRSADQWGRLVREFPDSPGHARDLAWLLATCPDPSVRDAARAVETARRAVQLAPRGGDCRRALGAALLRAGDHAGAVAELTEASRLRSGGDGREWLLLAMAHARLGDREAARSLYDRAVRWLAGATADVTLRALRTEVEAELGRP